MRAIVCRQANQPLSIETVNLAPPKANEVLVKIMATGVCASDVHVINGNMNSPLPVVLGHEGAGIVEEIGANVTSVNVGDHVALSWAPDCGRCYFCDSGYSNLCERSAPVVLDGGLLDGSSRLTDANQQTLYHYSFLSTWAEYAVVAEASCIVIDKTLDFVPASIIGCAVMTGVGAAINTAKVTPGSSVVVIGLGGVGLNVIQGARICGAQTIIGIDSNADKQGLAEQFGLTHFINANDVDDKDMIERVRELTDGLGAQYCFEAVGRTQLLELGYELIRRRGTLVAIGVAAEGESVKLMAPKLTREEKIITGSFYGSANCRLDFVKIAKLYRSGALLLDELVSQTLPMDKINQAVDDLRSAKVIRTVLTPHH